ncbi:hypothetical protein P4O66_011386, partial [Electrophorus voltai]
QMTDLLYTEKDLVTSLKDYIRAEENKLEQVKQWVEKLDTLTSTATQDPEGFLGHPVNAFKLVKRLNSEWADLENLVLQDTSDGFISNLTVQRQHFPTDEDQNGVAKALLRLQDTYQLSAHDISAGDLPGECVCVCLIFAQIVYLYKLRCVQEPYDGRRAASSWVRSPTPEADYYHTELWMAQALRQLDDGEDSPVDKVTVMDYLSYAIYQQGELERALEGHHGGCSNWTPPHQRANGNMKFFEFQLEKQRKVEEVEEVEQSSGQKEGTARAAGQTRCPDLSAPRTRCLRGGDTNSFCRGEGVKMTPRRRSRLFCRYSDNGRKPHLLLAPVKQEDEWDRPHIVRFYDIISDYEIEKVKELAKPRLRRATVHDPITGKLTTAQYRVSKSAWLTGHDHPVISKINQRLEDVTGLNMDTAEELQVANYGVGGQYEPHFDFGRKDEPDAFKELGTGNRIATWLFYMSDVPAGGATVFTDVGAAVWPKKGTAVFWYNLFASGEGDYSTRHAACPVLVGNKWVSNKWIHERGQEFRRPCGLSEME